MEASEIHEFSEQVQEGAEKRLKYVSLVIAVLAVLVAMVTVLGHRAHTEAVLTQSRAGDQWNLYQAKRIRMESLEVDVDMLQLEPTLNAAATQAKLKEYEAHIARWKDDLNEEEAKAKEYEAEVRKAERQAGHFDLGEALLQISVVLSSITLFTRRRSYFYGGLLLGVAGVIVAALAWIMP